MLADRHLLTPDEIRGGNELTQSPGTRNYSESLSVAGLSGCCSNQQMVEVIRKLRRTAAM